MREHVHTGLPSFLFAGLSAIVLIHLLRFAAAQLETRAPVASRSLAAFALAD